MWGYSVVSSLVVKCECIMVPSKLLQILLLHSSQYKTPSSAMLFSLPSSPLPLPHSSIAPSSPTLFSLPSSPLSLPHSSQTLILTHSSTFLTVSHLGFFLPHPQPLILTPFLCHTLTASHLDPFLSQHSSLSHLLNYPLSSIKTPVKVPSSLAFHPKTY